MKSIWNLKHEFSNVRSLIFCFMNEVTYISYWIHITHYTVYTQFEMYTVYVHAVSIQHEMNFRMNCYTVYMQFEMYTAFWNVYSNVYTQLEMYTAWDEFPREKCLKKSPFSLFGGIYDT